MYHNFIDCCKRVNIDVDNTFAFANSRKAKEDRIECRSSFIDRQPQQSFVIYYEKTLKLYFAWSLGVATAPTKTYFSVKISDMSDPNECGIRTIVKTISTPDRPTETVLVFDDEHILNFLKLVQCRT